MSNFLVAVGGSGAKVTQALIHLGAAGLLPPHRRELFCQLVDPDENNGNVEECVALFESYARCRDLLGTKLGDTDLFSAVIKLEGPWTPLREGPIDALKEIFQYDRLQRAGSIDAELLDLMFEAPELEMSIKQGFRGRPAIGATVLAQAVRFDAEPWRDLKDAIKARGAQGSVHVLLVGSVFGGSGASGVPTLVRLLAGELHNQLPELRLGLVLVLPYFQFKPIPGEVVQADPAAFPTATAEALKYYYERGFLDFCTSIYAVGEETPADVPISAIGAREQRNEAHFVELVAGMGGMRFFNDKVPSRDSSLAVAGRRAGDTLTWDDLPYDETAGIPLVRRLQTMVTFAVAYRYIFHPVVEQALDKGGRSDAPFWVDHITRARVNTDEAGRALRELDAYVTQFLTWMMRVSTPRRVGFTPGMVNPNVFAVQDAGGTWRLKERSAFADADFANLLLNQSSRTRLDARSVYQRPGKVSDPNATGVGRLVRSLYDACRVG